MCTYIHTYIHTYICTYTGYIPKMRLYAEGPSHMEGVASVPLPPEAEPQWTEEISFAEAASLIEKVMYPFKEASLLQQCWKDVN